MALASARVGLRQNNSNAVAFTPTSLPNLAWWYDAGQITGGIDATGLATWQDRSGNALNAVQATGANQPTYRTTTQLDPLGKPSVEFPSNINVVMTTTASAAPTASSHYIVAKFSVVTNPAALVGASVAGGIEIRINAGKIELLKQGVALVGTGTTAIVAGVWHVYEVQYDSAGGAWTMFIDGVASGSGTNVQALVASSLWLGNTAASEFATAVVADQLRYDRIVTASEATSLRSYFKTKHGTP